MEPKLMKNHFGHIVKATSWISTTKGALNGIAFDVVNLPTDESNIQYAYLFLNKENLIEWRDFINAVLTELEKD